MAQYPHKDRTGQKFGHLTFLTYSRPGGAGGGAHWLARCDCGEVREVVATQVAKGRVASCGKCQYHRELVATGAAGTKRPRGPRRDGENAKRYVYSHYAANALRREIRWLLTYEQFIELASKHCAYCNRPPHRKHKRDRSAKPWCYNGIDRVSSAGDYTLDNCVPCCKFCNIMKGTHNAAEFLDIVEKIYHHVVVPFRAARGPGPGTASSTSEKQEDEISIESD